MIANVVSGCRRIGIWRTVGSWFVVQAAVAGALLTACTSSQAALLSSEPFADAAYTDGTELPTLNPSIFCRCPSGQAEVTRLSDQASGRGAHGLDKSDDRRERQGDQRDRPEQEYRSHGAEELSHATTSVRPVVVGTRWCLKKLSWSARSCCCQTPSYTSK